MSLNNLTPRYTGRIHILETKDIDALYLRPHFNEEDQTTFFELTSSEEQDFIASNASLEGKVHFILAFGYFKCKKQFFQFNFDEVEHDVNYIMNRYFAKLSLDKPAIGQEARLANHQRILTLSGHQLYRKNDHNLHLETKSLALCRLSVDPIFIFWELLSFITNQKISRPGYTTLQKVIAHALGAEKKR